MNTSEQFEKAVAKMHQTRLAKLGHPGRFITRMWQRWRKEGAEYQARLFFDEQMSVVLPEVVSEVIYSYGFFDEEVTRMVLFSVRRGDTVLDVGAHFGYVSRLCAYLAGSNGRVFSFEPTPSTFCVLKKNMADVPGASPQNMGVGDCTSVLTIQDYGLRYCAWNTFASDSRMPEKLGGIRPNNVEVPIVRLDDFILEQAIAPDFIKVDAENFEHAVIAGAMASIRSNHPTLLLETGSISSMQACKLLSREGYRIYVCRNGMIEPFVGDIEKANDSFKDLLFIHPDRNLA